MSSNHSEDIFSKKVIPIMNKVRDDLQHKRADEMEKHSFSLAGLMVGAIGPDGGSAATQVEQQDRGGLCGDGQGRAEEAAYQGHTRD